MNQQPPQPLSEEEILNDFLMTEKQITSSLTTFITETNCPNLRLNLRNILNDEFTIQENIYNIMNQKGWYQPSNAQVQEVENTKTKYNQMQV